MTALVLSRWPDSDEAQSLLVGLAFIAATPIAGSSTAWAQNAEGNLALGARYPTNTSGGHLSESYMQGWLHVVEGVRQIRGESGERQVKDAEVCLVTGRGMTLNTASCLILGK